MGNRLCYPEVDLSGRVAVVTGGNAGIGYETAKALAEMGAHTIIACRSREKAEEAIERMKGEVVGSGGDAGKEVKLEFMSLDLASLASVRQFIQAFQEKNLPLHILINNAGIAWVPLERTEDGYEMHMQVNHLGHFLLTLELLPLLETTARETGDVRVVCLSSSTHNWATWEPDNLNGERDYSRTKAYPKSKMYNMMAAHAFQRRVPDVGITFSTVHPGLVNTTIVRGFGDVKILKVLAGGVLWMVRTPKQGAATSINCAVNPQLNSRQCLYYDNCRPATSSADSRNESYQEDLWQKSIEMVKDFLSPSTSAKYGRPHSPPPVAEAGPQTMAEAGPDATDSQ